MEEPPQIERIISSRGVSLSDTATVLKSYLSSIDQYHHPHDPPVVTDNDDAENATNENGEATETPRKSRQEREEEALIAQMDQLANDKSSSGMISDDVYERLKMITESICAEVEGKPWSASGMAAAPSRSAPATPAGLGDAKRKSEQNNGGDVLPAEWEDAEQSKEKGANQQQPPTPKSAVSKRDKKKEKKAKKAAKKAKKEAKRKSKELECIGDTRATKRGKTES